MTVLPAPVPGFQAIAVSWRVCDYANCSQEDMGLVVQWSKAVVETCFPGQQNASFNEAGVYTVHASDVPVHRQTLYYPCVQQDGFEYFYVFLAAPDVPSDGSFIALSAHGRGFPLSNSSTQMVADVALWSTVQPAPPGASYPPAVEAFIILCGILLTAPVLLAIRKGLMKQRAGDRGAMLPHDAPGASTPLIRAG